MGQEDESQLRPFIRTSDTETLIHAFVSSRLDYCNAIFIGLPATSIARLQYIQNSAARILTRTKLSAHITPILADLHWLPVAYCIKFKNILLTFKALNGLAPYYLCNLLLPYSSPRSFAILWFSPSLVITSLPWVADHSVLLPLNYGRKLWSLIITLYQDHAVKSSHLYLYSAFNNTNCNKALHNIKIGKLCQ